jgi:site-specific recombinase XerD
VQELLGHAKSETTDLYTKVGANSIRAAMLGASV